MDINRIDAYLQGASLDGYQEFGAHFSHEYDQDGARFTVYAPNASRVMLIGSFNGWTGYDMERLPSGVWTIFVQGIQEMDMYKYRIFTASGKPMTGRTRLPFTASCGQTQPPMSTT